MKHKLSIVNCQLSIILLMVALFASPLKAQVKIGDVTNPQSYSILEIDTTQYKGGLRMPQLTTQQRDSLSTNVFPLAGNQDASKGLVIFNTDSKCLEYWNNSEWISLCSDVAASPAANGINLTTAGLDNQNACLGSAISNIAYSTTGATGATVTGLPTGVTGAWASNAVTISGAPTVAGTFNYTVTLTGGSNTGTMTGTITVNTVPAQPSSITGSSTVNAGTTGLTYSVTNVSGVTYNWTLPSGWTKTAGGTTNSITVTAGTSGGTITVTPGNSCGSGTAQTLAVTVITVPAQPSAISGSATVCSGATGLTYSVTNISGVTYTWTLPSGWTQTAGGTTNSITVTAGTSGGTITVTPSNSVGNGTAQTLAVTVAALPGKPSAITGWGVVETGATGLTYSVTNVSGITYNWTFSGTGWTITAGQGTSSITVTAPTTSTNGATNTITVTPSYNSNGCAGTAQTLNVIVGCGAYSSSGKWLNFQCYNLGANTSINPMSGYIAGNADGSGGTLGWMFQWGRPADGHQLRNSGTTYTLSSSDTPGNNLFILSSSGNADWRSSPNDQLWNAGTESAPKKATNDPCPSGYRVPTETEWASIFDGRDANNTGGSPSAATANTWTWTTANGGGGYQVGSALYLPAAGTRVYSFGSLGNVGSGSNYWSSTPYSAYAYVLYFDSSGNVLPAKSNYGRAYGNSVRCVSQ